MPAAREGLTGHPLGAMDAARLDGERKPEETPPQAKSQENNLQDDGYETSNSGEARRKAPTPDRSPGALPDAAVDVTAPPAPPQLTREDAPATEVKIGSDKTEMDHEITPAGASSVSNSPERNNTLISNQDDSNMSAEASNSQSNSSMNTLKSNNRSFETNDVNARLLPPHEDSSQSQSNERAFSANQMGAVQNPYDLNKSSPMSHFGPGRSQEQLNFGSIKRESFDLPESMQDPYAQYRRDEQYRNDPYAKQYKRSEDMYPGNLQSYGNFGMLNKPLSYENMKNNQYEHNQQMYGGIKREQDEAMMSYNGIKRELDPDPYSFVDEDAAMCAMLGQNAPPQGMMGQAMMSHHMGHPDMSHMGMSMPNQQQLMVNVPKKRGRKKKIKDENGVEIKLEPGVEGPVVVKPVKERKKHDRFNGMSEEEVSRRTLPDHLAQNLDIIIIGINPGLFAAYKGHHYAGPGNHFWKCLYLSGLTREQMSADEDYKLLHFGIGFTNMVQRASKGSADLTRREIKEGSNVLLEKLQTFRPKIAVFNGKLIYEVFCGKKEFCFGKQPDTVPGTNTYMWVMPSSSARCAQLPRAADKVPFYAALKKFRDYLNGALHQLDEAELVFPDTTCRRPQEDMEIRRLTMEPDACDTMVLEDGTEVPLKKKRGRPKKIKLENGEIVPPTPRAPRQPRTQQPPLDPLDGDGPPKKKRGRPKKVKPDDQSFILQQQTNPQSMMGPLPPMPGMTQNPQPMEPQYQNQMEYSNQGMGDQMGSGPMGMYPGNINQTQQMSHSSMQGPSTSPYFQHSNQTMPQGPPSAPQESQPQDMGSLQNQAQNPLNAMQRSQPGYGQSPGPYSQSPRPAQQGMGYNQSPRPQGYSQSPQRHPGTPSYSNSPVPRPTGTPQPAQPIQSPYPPSPAQQNPNPQYSQTSPQRPQSQNRNYSSPVRNPYSRSPIPQNNTPTYTQPQQSPMYAQSPVNSAPNQNYSQPSPASQSVPNYSSQSPAPNRFSQSPVPQSISGHPGYSRSPAPQGMQGQSYAQSPSQVTPFPQHSPAIPGAGSNQGYSHSPANTPYSQHNSPAQNPSRSSYVNSPQNMSLHYGSQQSPLHSTANRSGSHPFSVSPPPQNNQSNNGSMNQYQTDLSTEISAAISSPGPSSPGIGHIDFEPPIATNKIRVPENEATTPTNQPSQENSPLGSSTEMQVGSNSNSSVNDYKPASNVSDNQGYGSNARDRDLSRGLESVESQIMQMQQESRIPSHNSNRHSALNLIGPPSSTPSDMSSPIPSGMDTMGLNSGLRNTPTYNSSIYGNESLGNVPSPLQHEQRLGFQVPTPSGSANSTYGHNANLGGLGVASHTPSPKSQMDATITSHHDRLANSYGYQDQGSSMGGMGSPREMPHQLHPHASGMYGSPFNRVASSPHHPLAVQASQSSPFTSQGAPGAFRGLAPPTSSHDNQSSSVGHSQSAGSPADYGGIPKTKSQDVASKSLSGLESLVDQIPSIGDGPAQPVQQDSLPPHPTNPAPVAPLPDPYAGHPPTLYNPYNPYQTSAYGPANNSYASSALTANPFGGYPGNPYGQLMRPTPAYLPEALSPYHHHHTGYPGLPSNQYAPGGPAYATPTGPPNYSAYYNGYPAPSAMQNPANMPTYLSSHVLDHIHKNAAADAASSVSFGGFC